MQYSIGDKIICRVNDDETIIFDVDWNDERYKKFKTKLFEVVSLTEKEYVILVSSDVQNAALVNEEILNNLLTIASSLGVVLNTDRLLDKHVYMVRENSIGGRDVYDPYKEPLACLLCKEYVPWALPNQEDDGFICWVCRNTRLYEK